MKREALSMEQAKQRSADYPYVLLRQLSRVYLGKTEGITADWDEVTEARFFDENSELRVFETENGLSAACLTQEESDTCLEKRERLISGFGKYLTVRRYIDYDKDGQLYISATRLAGWEEE